MSEQQGTRTASQQIKHDSKRDPEEQAKFLARMIRSTARRCTDEDPENGLAMLLQVQALLDELVDDTMLALIEQTGPQLVAAGLGMSKQAMNKRMGPNSPRRAAVVARRETARQAAWAKAHRATSKAVAASRKATR
jgi:hypothetical protein